MEYDNLSKEFMATGKQPDFKSGFDFVIITQNNDGANLVYFNLDEVPTVTVAVDKDEIIVDVEKSFLICLTEVGESDVPNIVKNVAKIQK